MILAAIHLIPMAVYGAIAVGSAVATWLSTKPPKEPEPEKKEKKEPLKIKKLPYYHEKTPDEILSRDLLAPSPDEEEQDDTYEGDDRFELMDLK